ncbi:MAG: hypothetical protein AB7G25_05910 [Sphingomonadaceae bacterium]
MADSVMSKADDVRAFVWTREKSISFEIIVQEDDEQNSAAKAVALPRQLVLPMRK